MHIERLHEQHKVHGFFSGNTQLDYWLQNYAVENQARDISRTFVLVDDEEIVGYYSLTMGGLRAEQLPAQLGRGLPQIEIGMVLIGRLAIGSIYQRQGYGRDILIDAISRAVHAGSQVAARFIAVDPIDDSARHFYSHFGFMTIHGDEFKRMFLRMDEALSALNIST